MMESLKKTFFLLGFLGFLAVSVQPLLAAENAAIAPILDRLAQNVLERHPSGASGVATYGDLRVSVTPIETREYNFPSGVGSLVCRSYIIRMNERATSGVACRTGHGYWTTRGGWPSERDLRYASHTASRYGYGYGSYGYNASPCRAYQSQSKSSRFNSRAAVGALMSRSRLGKDRALNRFLSDIVPDVRWRERTTCRTPTHSRSPTPTHKSGPLFGLF